MVIIRRRRVRDAPPFVFFFATLVARGGKILPTLVFSTHYSKRKKGVVMPL
jgi:hypothetical protein